VGAASELGHPDIATQVKMLDQVPALQQHSNPPCPDFGPFRLGSVADALAAYEHRAASRFV
jgi:hypothetical protein